MAPIVGGIGLPEGEAGGEHGAVEHGGKLHKTTKKGGLAHRDWNGLNQAAARVGLHGAHHFQQAVTGHNTVGIEHNHLLVVGAPALAELGEVAHFAANIFFAAAIKHLLA